MNETKRLPLNAEVVVKEGVSKKTNNPYKMTFIRVHTEVFGDIEFLVDTNKDRAGIILNLLVNA